MKNETKTKSKLTQEIKENYEAVVCYTIEEHRYEKINTIFEISIEYLNDVDGWDYEDELGEIFDDILDAYNSGEMFNPHYYRVLKHRENEEAA